MLRELARHVHAKAGKRAVHRVGGRHCAARVARDGVQVDIVEINPAMVRVAKDFFDCPTEKLNLTIGDGRQL